MDACLAGAHKAVNPHRQRLLVAAHKATRALPKAKCKGKKKALKAIKPKQKKPYPTGATATKSENEGGETKKESTSAASYAPKPEIKVEPGVCETELACKPDTSEKPKKKYADTHYNIARKKFFAESLGLKSVCSRCYVEFVFSAVFMIPIMWVQPRLPKDLAQAEKQERWIPGSIVADRCCLRSQVPFITACRWKASDVCLGILAGMSAAEKSKRRYT